MIRLCTCTGGSASTLELSRKGAATASCKTCGGKQLVDRRGSLSGSMLSTVGLELTSLINPDLTWKTVSKGNRSASRRARKPVIRSLKESRELVDKGPERVDEMPVSESEKLGVTILGCRFNDKIEHVPIKKRRFLFRSPSPPPRTPSPRTESERLIDSHPVAGQESYPDSIAKQKLMAIDAAVAMELGQFVDRKNSTEKIEKVGVGEDFSGISILAAVACNNSMGGDDGNVEEGSVTSVAEESSVREGFSEILVNKESCLVAKQLSKEHLLNSSAITNEGTDSCTSAMPVEETISSSGAANSSTKDLTYGYDMEGSFFPDNSVPVLQNRPSNKDDETLRKFESSLLDDRSHWDLNTVMDAWEHSGDVLTVESHTNFIDGISEDGMHEEKLGNLEGCEMQMEPGDTKYDIERTLPSVVERVVSGDVHGDVYGLADSRSLAFATHKSSREEYKLDACLGPDGTTCFEEKVLSSEIDNGQISVMGPAEETKPLHNQERINFVVESVVSSATVERPLQPSTSAVAEEDAFIQCGSFCDTGNSEIISSHKVISMDPSPCLQSDHITSTWVSEENKNTVSTSAIAKPNRDDHAADGKFDETICLRAQAEKHDVALPHAAVSEKATHKIDGVIEDGEDADRTSDLHDDGNVPKKMMSMDTCQLQGYGCLDDVKENAVIKSDEMDTSESSPNCEELSASAASVGKCLIVEAADTKVLDGKVSVVDTAEVDDHPVHFDSEELSHKLSEQSTEMLAVPGCSHEACESYGDDPVNSSGKVALEDPFDDSYDSDFSHDDPGHGDGIEKMSELQVDYDSQYEDGELRESAVHSWEEDAGEDGEAEQVDYGSDNRDTFGFDAGDYSVSMSVQVEEEGECKKEKSTDADHICCEGGLVMANKQETIPQSCLGGSSMLSIVEAGSNKKRALKAVNTHLRLQFARKDDIEKFEMDVNGGRELSAGAGKVGGENGLCIVGDAAEEATTESVSFRMKMSGWDQLPEGSRSFANKTLEVSDDSARRNCNGDRVDRIDAEDSMMRVVRSTTSKRELLSRIEGPTSSDASLGKDRVCLQGSRPNNLDDSNTKAERETRSAKLIGRGLSHMHGRGRGGDWWADPSEGHFGLKRYHSPTYHDSAGYGRPGPKNAATAVAAKVENSGLVVAPDGTIVKAAGSVGHNGNVRRQSVNSSSQGGHRSLMRRGSPTDRDEAFGMHMGIGQVGRMSPNRNLIFGRGRSGRYGPRVVGRGPRERYHGHVPDIAERSLHMPHPLARRERSFSPILRRGSPHLSRSHTKSPSRSGTRSPREWSSPRGRNRAGIGGGPGFRRCSGSPPNFKSEARMERRSPYRQSGFAADHIVGYMPRSRGSPQHTSRWINDRRDAADHFRDHDSNQQSSYLDRRSPGRIHPRNHRFDLVDSRGSLDPDEYYRPRHLGRFTEMVGGGRGHRYEGSYDDRRKHGNRYGMMVRPVRRYDMDGPIKRFRYDVEDGFAAHNSHNKDGSEFHGSPKDYDSEIDSRLRDAPRRSREERGHFRYGRDGKHNASSKSFGMRECDDEEFAPRRRRPS